MSDTNDVVRKLTTIMAADVVGYSKLMSEDEENTLRTFRTYRKVIDGLIEKHGGRIFNTAGDAVLAEFDSAVEGVRCTVSIQEELATRNEQLPEDKRILLRIGVNVGDVMIEGDDLFGDGVNVAARLEGLAAPGSVCISQSTFEQVKNKLSIGFEDMGPQNVKNIPNPVGAFQLMSGPISVSQPEASISQTKSSPPWKTVAIAAGVALVLAVGGVAVWQGQTGHASTQEATTPPQQPTFEEQQKLMQQQLSQQLLQENMKRNMQKNMQERQGLVQEQRMKEMQQKMMQQNMGKMPSPTPGN